MGNPQGFLKITERKLPVSRPVAVRIRDYREVYEAQEITETRGQASRCMDCGVPFCHNACPLGNIIPEWNDLVWQDDWAAAADRLHATNNFPDFTGRLCPAPCESACVLGINQPPVTIKNIEHAIIDQAFERNLVQPQIPDQLTGFTIAVIGSGPAGLAAAQQLTRVGHTVAVYEKDDRIGGLLRYGIPEFKLEKSHVDRRIFQMTAEGTRFYTGMQIGQDITGEELLERYDVTILALGTPLRRDLEVKGRGLDGIYQAMDYLTDATRTVQGDRSSPIFDAAGKDVVIIGGGDTGADCLGTAIRQGARSVTSLEIMPKLPIERTEGEPWPTFPRLFKVASAHEEGGRVSYATSTVEFVGDTRGRVRGLKICDVTHEQGRIKPLLETERTLPAQMILLAMGFTGVPREGLVEQLHLELDERGRVVRDANWKTNTDRVYVTGDAGRGQSLIVWAIAEGRSTAAAVDNHLRGRTDLPVAVTPNQVFYTP